MPEATEASRRWFVSPRAADRLAAAERFLRDVTRDTGALVVGATAEAAASFVRRRFDAIPTGALVGWERLSLGALAGRLAALPLAEEDRVAAAGLAIEALVARIVHQLGPEGVGRFAPVVAEPGLPRALATTLRDLRLAGLDAATVSRVDPDLGHLLEAFDRGLREERLADRAEAFAVARAVVVGERPGAEDALALVGRPMVLLDARVAHRLEAELVVALVERGERAMATLPAGERRAARLLQDAFGALPPMPDDEEDRAPEDPSAARFESAPRDAGNAPASSGPRRPRRRRRAPNPRQLLLFDPDPPPDPEPRAEDRPGEPASAAPKTSGGTGDLARLQRRLFEATRSREAGAPDAQPWEDDGSVEIFSAPGEGRECVEVARRVLAEAAAGTPFDRMAVLVRAPTIYRVALVEALDRANIPFVASRGARRPNPDGRAVLALLSCKAEGLSARAFAEYLSLGVLPTPGEDGAPPEAPDEAARWTAPDDELVPLPPPETAPGPDAGTEQGTPDEDDAEADGPVSGGGLRSPRRWEQLLVDAAVVGGADRWRRRLDGLDATLAADRTERVQADPDDPRIPRIDRRRQELAALRAFALPILDRLAALPDAAPWGAWLEALSALAHASVRRPETVQRVLAELAPMAPVGPIGLDEVRLVLEERLSELVEPPPDAHDGALRLATVDEARGLSYDVVFLPGLAERIFPQKVVEDPVLLDGRRAEVSADLALSDARVEDERLALRIGVGAATRRVVLSYPRVEAERARPRVPSFYGLEVMRAVTGRLPSFEELGRRAESAGRARMGWPAPEDPKEAIDLAEYDLAVLRRLVQRPPEERRGAARYLLEASPHLRRALRFRGRRWLARFGPADGLVDPTPGARAALDRHRLAARPYSPTALESYAYCPYRFYLRAVLKLSPREIPEPIDDLDPLQRGRLIHEAQLRLLEELRDADLLELPDQAAVDDALARLDRVVRRVAAAYEEELVPAIDRVFEDGVDEVRADLREWLRRVAQDPWRPALFELAFGLPGAGKDRDPASTPEPVALDEGVLLRGSIDLVERRGSTLRATDHKTGRAWVGEQAVIDGGTTLQPVLYALVLEKLFPETTVEEGRLFYCTSRGDFAERRVPLDAEARAGIRTLVQAVGSAIEDGFLPAAPKENACRFCDYQTVCGPHEERRIRGKRRNRLDPLLALRDTR